MSTNESTTRRSKQRWAVPLVALAIGAAYFVAGWLGDDLFFGVFGLSLMVVTAGAFLLLSRHSETVAGLLDRRDERINKIDLEATTISGMALTVAVIVAFIVEIAQGKDGLPYSMLGAVAGVAYVAALVVLRFRR